MTEMTPEQSRLLFIACVSLAWLFELWSFRQGAASQRWFRVTARVTDAWLDDYQDSDGGRREYTPKIRYAYSYKGRSYVGKKFAYGNVWSTNRGIAQSGLVGVVPGGEIQIYVNPDAPGQSVIHRGYHGSFFGATSLFIVVVAAAIYFT